MTYSDLHGRDQVALWCALAAALIAALFAWLVKTSEDTGALIGNLRWTRLFLGLTLLIVGLRMVVVLLIADHGRASVEDRIIAEIPLLLILAAGAGPPRPTTTLVAGQACPPG